jgi:hypothetical protein
MVSGNWMSFGFGEHLVEGVLTNDLAERRLRDLIDCLLDVLDGDD